MEEIKSSLNYFLLFSLLKRLSKNLWKIYIRLPLVPSPLSSSSSNWFTKPTTDHLRHNKGNINNVHSTKKTFWLYKIPNTWWRNINVFTVVLWPLDKSVHRSCAFGIMTKGENNEQKTKRNKMQNSPHMLAILSSICISSAIHDSSAGRIPSGCQNRSMGLTWETLPPGFWPSDLTHNTIGRSEGHAVHRKLTTDCSVHMLFG